MRPRAWLLLLALCMASPACTKVGTGGGTSERHAFTQPHVLRFAEAEDIFGHNPLIGTQAVVADLSQLTMAWLIRTDARSAPTVPELCTEVPSLANGGIGKDGKTITWHLRRGVKWADGVPFTADDVVFSTQQVLNPQNNVVSRDGWELISKIGEPDKYTVVYHLSRPYSSFAVTFFSTAGANPAILPKHLLQGYKNLNDVPYNALPVGIGPFKYESWKRGDVVTLVPNPLYWRGTPKLQRVIFKIIPSRDTVLEQMKTHELDLWVPVSPHYVSELRQIPGTKLFMTPSFFYDHLDFNTAHPALRDPLVRQALRMGIDRNVIDQKVRFGIYIVQESVVPPASQYHVDVPLAPFDLQRANAMLDAAGWKRGPGPGGIRQKDGVRLSLDFATGVGLPDTDLQIELIRSWWQQLGVELSVRHYLAAIFFAPAPSGGIVLGGKFDVTNFAWGGDPNQDLANLYSCARFPPNGQNDLRYCNRAVTAAIDRTRLSYDPVARAKDLAFIQRQIAQDAPTVVLDARRQIYAFNDDLKNFHPNPVAPFDDVMQVDI